MNENVKQIEVEIKALVTFRFSVTEYNNKRAIETALETVKKELEKTSYKFIIMEENVIE